MSIELDLQLASTASNIPEQTLFIQWCTQAILPYQDSAELTIRIVDGEEGRELNHVYRHKDYATNVLSFPSELPEGLLDIPLLGDLVICAPIVAKEAKEQQKSLEGHWAHLVTHGCLHLLGFDHETADQANEMEAIEIQLLTQQGYHNPYHET